MKTPTLAHAVIADPEQHTVMDDNGSVRSIQPNVAVDVWRALGTRNGGEIPGDF